MSDTSAGAIHSKSYTHTREANANTFYLYSTCLLRQKAPSTCYQMLILVVT